MFIVVSNHPVHIVSDNGQILPSALIPFCEFGGSNSVLGINSGIRNFNVTVCNSFQAKILNDQLCYEVDPNKYKSLISSDELKQGLKFYIDTNGDRQTTHGESQFMIYLDTLGIKETKIASNHSILINCCL